MGRLIDADKFEAFVIRTNGDEEFVNGVQYVLEKIDNASTVEAIPTADYENRLKADMVAMLTEIQLEIAELPAHVVSNMGSIIRMEIAPSAEDVYEVIQEKINSLKENKDAI